MKINSRPKGVALGGRSTGKTNQQILIFHNPLRLRKVKFDVALNVHAHRVGSFL